MWAGPGSKGAWRGGQQKLVPCGGEEGLPRGSRALRSWPRTLRPEPAEPAEAQPTGHTSRGWGWIRVWEGTGGTSRPHPATPTLVPQQEELEAAAQPTWPSPGLPLSQTLFEG